ncbi:MAG TPA: hypothetical protein VI248_04495 [Kineosporiaceae bacterium]
MTTARDVIEMLRRHYLPESRPPGGIFAPEIESPCGKRRADLIWMPTTIAGGRGLVGHEVKVTRPDVLAELADPTKADPWARYCSRWWLVVAEPELVDGLVIPDAWGIMAPPSGRRTRSMTILRPAPTLDPLDGARGVERLAAWMLYRHHGVEHELRAQVAYRDRTIVGKDQQIERLRAEGPRGTHPESARVGKILAAVEAGATSEHLWSRVNDEAVVRAVLDTEHARRAAAEVLRGINLLAEALEEDPLRLARSHLQRLRESAASGLALRTGGEQ